ncbi:mediator of DNA damage checkpoint protein 1 isoform X1 [Delphinapterus leucas]|uniref:Mediator of DNA damage checkpoint protein 1 n=2 Tax=Delphinapterus leucas TaxID=9749 RepID=A0A7F8K1D6_DELLE|nr:mediator of DNA damage checkpoint protein 1 isoform X1 [Delphinapterus leucas]
MLGATTMIMEDTQVINWEVEQEEEVEERPSESLGCSLEPLGRLRIFSSSYGPEKDFPLYLGKNVVGRMPDCSVALPYSSISKQHAVIEILAWDKAPVLRDCGSLNGTQILRPPKVLGPGVSHRLRDRELILFADLPCQYHRLDVPLPFVSRGPLTIEETPRVQGGTQPHRLLLAEDSEEEVDSLSEKCVVKGPRTSFLATVVPESDEEGPSSPLDVPGPPFAFNLNSDTDEEESQQPGAGEGSSAARRVTAAETEQPKPVTTGIQLEKDQCSVKEKNNDTKVERSARSRVVPVGVILERSQPAGEDSDTDVDDESGPLRRLTGVHLERAQPCGFIDSDTDVEEEGIPATPAVVPVRKRHSFHEVGTESPRAPGVAHQQESPDGSDTDIEEGEAPLTVPLDKSRASVVIDSNTDDKEEVSAALTLAHLRESRAVAWNRDPDAEDDRAQPVALLEQSQASAGRDSDTDVKEKGLPVEKTGTVPRGHTGKAYSEKSHPSLRDSDTEVTEEKSSPGFQASATVHVNTQVVEEVPPGPAVILLEKHQVPVAWTHQTDVEAEGGPAKLPVVYLEEARPPPARDCDPDAEENASLAASAVADVRKSQLQAEEDTGTERAVAVLEQGRAFMAGAQGGSPVAQVEQDLLPGSRNNIADLVVDTGTPGEPTQPQRRGAQTPTEREREPHVDRTMDSGDNHDDSEDLDLQATQCFVERENQSLEVPSVEDEPTQAFLFTLPQEPGPSRCSFQATGSLDEPWEVLATQPFCPRESEASEPQPIATHIEAHASCPSPPTAAPQEQHPESPVHAEPLGIQGRGMQTVEEDMGTPRETAERVTPEREPLERETEKLPSEGEREDVMGEEESTRGIQDREQKQVLARDTQKQESDKKVKSASTERDMESLKVEIETPEEIQEKEREKQTLTREIFDREAEKPVAERECEAGGLQGKVPKVMLDRGPQTGETEAGGQDQKGQASGSTPEPGVGAGDLQGLASDPIASGSQSGGGRGAPVGPRRQQRGYLNCKMPPAEKASRGDQESPDACRPPALQEASAPLQNPLISQSQKHPAPQSLLSPSLPPLERPIPRTRQNESQEALETPFSSELDSLHPKPKVKPQGSSPVSSVPLEPHPTASTDQLVTPKPTSRATRGRTLRSSVKTPERNVSTVPELQPSAHTDQAVTPKPTSRATRGRTQRASVKTPEPVISTAPGPQPSTPTDQAVTPKPTSRATRGRTQRASVKTPEPVIATAPEPHPSTPTSQATRGRTQRASVKAPEPVISTAPEPQPSTPTDQPVTPKPTSQATRGRTQRASVKAPEPVIATAPEPQPSTPTDQPVTPKPTSRATRGRTQRASVKTPEPDISTAPEPQPSTPTDQPVTPKPTSQATRGRTQRASVKAPEPVISTAPEPQPSTPTDQPVTPKPTSPATRGRTQRASVKAPEPVISTAPESQPSTPTDQPVTHKPTSRATRGRTQRASVKTPEPVIATAPAPQPSTPTDQPVTPKPTSQATRGRTLRSSVKTPERNVPTAPELQPSAHTDQPVTPKPTSRAPQGRTLRSSAKAPEPVVPITPEPQPSTSKDQSLTPEPTSQATRGRTQRSSVKTSQPTEPTAPDLEPSSPTEQPVTPKVIAQGGQSRTLRSSTVNAVPAPTTPESHSPVPTGEPIPPEPIPEANCSRRPRATRKHGSLTAHVHEPYSAPSEPNSSRNQRRGAVRAAESLSTIPEPAFAQLPEAPTRAPQIPKGEAADRSGFTPEPQPEASQNRKRPLATADSPPLQKRLQRGEVPQKTAFLKEEEENPAAKQRKEEDVVIPGPGKRKREQTEEEPREIPSRSLRRTKPLQESTAPKVLFTGVVDAHGERAVLALGGSLASSVAEASHLVTDRIRRTVKFLCALGRGIPILSLDWLHQSHKAGCFLPPAEYVVTDPEQEKNFGFSLREALSRARERRLLEGYEIHVTPGVQPPPPQMGEIISCCGGTVLPSMPRSYKPQRVVITCSQDFPRCAIPFRVGLPILSPEFLLTGVLKQEAKPEAFVLSTLEVSST